MAESVVDVLELVEIEVKHGEARTVAGGGRNGFLDGRHEGVAVVQSCQRVTARGPQQLCLGPSSIGDVPEEPYATEVLSDRRANRARVTIDMPAVFGFELVASDALPMSIDQLKASIECSRIVHRPGDCRLHGRTVGFSEKVERDSPHVHESLIEQDDPRVGVDHKHAVERSLHPRFDQDIGEVEALLCELQVRNIRVGANEPRGRTIRRPFDAFAAALNPDPMPVTVALPVFDIPDGPRTGVRLAGNRPHPLPVFRMNPSQPLLGGLMNLSVGAKSAHLFPHA